ncbi:hypothetical protein JCM11641_001918 [Rhodosporidiobolus odoratus]
MISPSLPLPTQSASLRARFPLPSSPSIPPPRFFPEPIVHYEGLFYTRYSVLALPRSCLGSSHLSTSPSPNRLFEWTRACPPEYCSLRLSKGLGVEGTDENEWVDEIGFVKKSNGEEGEARKESKVFGTGEEADAALIQAVADAVELLQAEASEEENLQGQAPDLPS